MIDLKPEHLNEIKRILSQWAPNYEVRAFGSRVKGKATPYSDLDLALVSDEPLDWRKIGAIKEAFSESSLPFMVDILDWHSLSDEFKQIIKNRYDLIQKPK